MNYHILGVIGTGIVLVGYLPQIIHLVRERCAWGISQRSWMLWLLGGCFLLAYSLLKRDIIFSAVQVIQIVAISLTIYYARRSIRVCPHHLAEAAAVDGDHDAEA
jgi:lipid-A-disaccharide synthase-like uncharacterized protein